MAYAGRGMRSMKIGEFGTDEPFLRTGSIAVRVAYVGEEKQREVQVEFGNQALQIIEAESTYTLLKDFKRYFATQVHWRMIQTRSRYYAKQLRGYSPKEFVHILRVKLH